MGQGGETAQQGQTGGEAAQQNGEAQAAPDFSALSSQMEQMAGGMEEMRQFLASNPWQAQEAQQQETAAAPEVDLSFLDVADPGYDPEQISQKMTEAVGQYVQQAIQQGTAPVQEQMQEMQREQ